MKKENKELLEKVIEKRLTESLNDPSGNSEAFKEAMEAIDRQTKIDDANKEKILKFVEIGAAIIAAPLIEVGCKKAFAKMICEFEKYDTFTTTAGRSLSGLFKFKK